MKILRSISIGLAVAFAVVVFAACGGSSNTTQSSSETTPTISAAPETPAETAQKFSHEYDEEHKVEKVKAKRAAKAKPFNPYTPQQEHEKEEAGSYLKTLEHEESTRKTEWGSEQGIAARHEIEVGMKAAGTESTNISCSVHRIESNYSPEEVIVISAGVLRGEEAPTKFKSILEECQ